MKKLSILVCLVSVVAFSHPFDEDSYLTSEYLNAEYQRDRGRFEGIRRSEDIDVAHYALKGRFNWELLRLYATVDIRLKLKRKVSEISLDSQVSFVESIESSGLPLAYQLDATNHLLKIDLTGLPEATLAEEFVISIRYQTDSNSSTFLVGGGFLAALPSLGDPVRSRVVYTTSEPRGASFWLPCHNVPTDRATFSIELNMPATETLISNGDLVRNEIVGNERIMKYATKHPLPNYLMAFAQGEFNTVTTYHGSLPVSIWSRQGLPGDFNGMLREIIRQMAHYEKLLISYPWEKYSVVLLPNFGGGMENASITFQGEGFSTSSQNSGDLSMTAHELGHQWFGDFVSVKTWDDLWIKEGMATLMAEEASRPYEDQNNRGRLFGRSFMVVKNQAIMDPALAPESKYTSGPYTRAAWFLTQIRSVVGEQNFWGTLRDILLSHAWGNIGTQEFLDAFRAALGENLYAKAKLAVLAKAIPQIDIVPATEDSPSLLQLADSDTALLAPIELRWYLDPGNYETRYLSAGNNQPLLKDRYLVVEPTDRHPIRSFARDFKLYKQHVVPLTIPTTPETIATFLAQAGHVHSESLTFLDFWKFTSAEFLPLYEGLASDRAKFYALRGGCFLAFASPISQHEAWRKALENKLLNPPLLGVTMLSDFSNCRSFFPETDLKDKLALIARHPSSPPLSEQQLYYYSLLGTEATPALASWGTLAKHGASIRSRTVGVSELQSHTRGLSNFPKPAESELPKWKKFFRELLSGTSVGAIVSRAVSSLSALQDEHAWLQLAQVTRSNVLANAYRRQAVCAAYSISKQYPATWPLYLTELDDLSAIPEAVRQYVENPEKCSAS